MCTKCGVKEHMFYSAGKPKPKGGTPPKTKKPQPYKAEVVKFANTSAKKEESKTRCM
jgi:hypothetical protein